MFTIFQLSCSSQSLYWFRITIVFLTKFQKKHLLWKSHTFRFSRPKPREQKLHPILSAKDALTVASLVSKLIANVWFGTWTNKLFLFVFGSLMYARCAWKSASNFCWIQITLNSNAALTIISTIPRNKAKFQCRE